MNEIKTIFYLNVKHVEQISRVLAKVFLDRKAEPIPDFQSVQKNLLSSAIERPKASFGKELYPTLEKKAVALFYSLIKNHPFPNGNKRIASTTLITFLHVNDLWLDCKRGDIVRIARMVANSKPKSQKLIENRLESWLKSHLVSVSTSTQLPPLYDLLEKSKKLLKIKRPRKSVPKSSSPETLQS